MSAVPAADLIALDLVREPFGDVWVRQEGESVTVTCFDVRAIFSIDYWSHEHGWNVIRCFVTPTRRSQGIGSRLMQLALKAIHERDENAKVFVCPGGYSDALEAQQRFYLRNGFVLTSEENVFQWRAA